MVKPPHNAVTAQHVAIAIRQITADWIALEIVNSAQHLNNGRCFELATQIQEQLRSAGFDCGGLADVCLKSFQKEGDPEHVELDRALLDRFWPQVQPPDGLSWNDLDKIAKERNWHGTKHAWLILEEQHFDAECPEGTTNFLELPFFQREIYIYREKYGI